MVRSKFSINAWFFTLLLTGFVVLGLIFLSHPQWHFKNKFGGTNSAIVPGIILVVLMGAILVFLVRNLVVLLVDRDKLCLYSLRGRRTVQHTAIVSIDLWGRTRLNGAPSELIRVELKDGEKIDLNGGSYRNLPELKKALEANYPELLVAAPQNHVRPGLSVDPRVFAGPVLTSLKGIVFYGLLAGAIIIGISWRDVILLPLVFFSPMVVIFGVQLYYFRLTTDTLEILNHVAPWYRKSYPLTNIANIELGDSYTRWSRTMRVRTFDHHNDSYPAGTLRKRHWQALARELRKRGLQVNTQNLGTKVS